MFVCGAVFSLTKILGRRLCCAPRQFNRIGFSSLSLSHPSPPSGHCFRFLSLLDISRFTTVSLWWPSSRNLCSSEWRTMAEKSDCTAKKSNRLALEKSPYLLQHAHNPVDWYPWGDEAFERAKAEDKLIFLSVGYSTCHWCHVMERESFENEAIAKIMNQHFINIKVDREERPDVDRVYMTFVQATSEQGGWPMSVWLTPDLKAVHGGTYFPPDDIYYGHPGFKSLLLYIAQQWQENRQKFFDSGSKIMEILQKNSKLEASPDEESIAVPEVGCWKKCFSQMARSYEPEYGGFGSAPKFPQPCNFDFMFHVYARNPTSEEGKQALDMCTYTLRMMAKGGIHDHVSQGFARYSTDEQWHVPHFEKMLYDQGQLLTAFAAAYTATKDELFAEMMRDIVTYVNRDLSHPLGGYYSAEDADSLPSADSAEKREGAFCVWTHEEVDSLLREHTVGEGSAISLSQLACHHFDIRPKGNVNPYQDPHDELKHKNVLIIRGSEAETAEKFGLSAEEVRSGLQRAKEILHTARQSRPRPHLDDKMVAAWNGLMLSGLSKASEALGDEAMAERAEKVANFIEEHLYCSDTNTLLRSCYQGPDGTVAQISQPIDGFADDYAFVIRGLLDVYEARGSERWLTWAERLQDKQDELFWDQQDGAYFSAASSPSLVLRLKEDQDGAEPACNSVSAHNLLRLASLLERPELEKRAARLLAAFRSRLSQIPVALPEMSSALLFYHDSPTQVFVVGAREATVPLLQVVRGRLVAGRVLGLVQGEEGLLRSRNQAVSHMRTDRPAAYVCRNHTCSLPVTDPGQLAALLQHTPTTQ